MSLIEQAAKRLEQLRQAGVDIPEESAPLAPPLTNHVQATPKPEVAEPPPAPRRSSCKNDGGIDPRAQSGQPGS